MRFLFSSILLTSLVTGNLASRADSTGDPNFLALDYSAIRGANYTAAAGHHLEHWLHYDPKVTDREGWVTRTVLNGVAWLHDTNATYARGLDLVETAANLLEANQLVAMRDLPTRRVAILREDTPDPSALRELLADLVSKLEPYERKADVP